MTTQEKSTPHSDSGYTPGKGPEHTGIVDESEFSSIEDDLGLGEEHINSPDNKRVETLDFMDLYIRIDKSAGYGTESRYQTDDSVAMTVVPPEYEADIAKIRDALRTMDSADGGLPEKGFRFFHDGIRYRGAKTETISSNQSTKSETVVCLRRFKKGIPDINSLPGWQSYDRAYLKRLFSTTGGGLVIVSGPTGSGKTTTGIACITYSSRAYAGLTFMAEDPCEYILNGPDPNASDKAVFMQHEVQDESEWGSLMKIGLRFHPRSFYIGEVRDSEVAAQALLAGVTGHIVVLTLHGFSCGGAISALIQRASSVMTEDLAREMLADGLLAVVHQVRNARMPDGTIEKFKMSILDGGSHTSVVRDHIRKNQIKMLEGCVKDQESQRKSGNFGNENLAIERKPKPNGNRGGRSDQAKSRSSGRPPHSVVVAQDRKAEKKGWMSKMLGQ